MLKIVRIILVAVALGSVSYFIAHKTGVNVPKLLVPAMQIDELLAHPEQYDGRTVSIEGAVNGSTGIFGFGGYRLQKIGGRESILVVSRVGIPATGTVVTVTGIFKQALVVNSFQYSVVIQE